MQKSVRVIIWGKVQGVYFRAWTVKTASSLHLCGWVRNKNDGTVEAIFSGQEDIVNNMLELCWEGSPASEVKNVEVFEWDGEVEERFVQR
jgi:acylphosphatase